MGHLHKTVGNSQHNNKTSKPNVDRSQLRWGLCLLVHAVVEEAENKLSNHCCNYDYTNYLMGAIEVFCLRPYKHMTFKPFEKELTLLYFKPI